jgi:hypothetical protein
MIRTPAGAARAVSSLAIFAFMFGLLAMIDANYVQAILFAIAAAAAFAACRRFPLSGLRGAGRKL